MKSILFAALLATAAAPAAATVLPYGLDVTLKLTLHTNGGTVTFTPNSGPSTTSAATVLPFADGDVVTIKWSLAAGNYTCPGNTLTLTAGSGAPFPVCTAPAGPAMSVRHTDGSSNGVSLVGDDSAGFAYGPTVNLATGAVSTQFNLFDGLTQGISFADYGMLIPGNYAGVSVNGANSRMRASFAGNGGVSEIFVPYSIASQWTVEQVPEPAMLGLFGLGALGLGLRRKRGKR